VLANLRPNCNVRRDVRDVRAVHLRSSFRPVSIERERDRENPTASGEESSSFVLNFCQF
jgi:hypothetical protein